jgi:cysteine-rich repeat protein
VSLWEAEGDATDSADGNDGALANGATFGTGFSGQAFSLDGDDDAVIVPNAVNLQLQDFTISAWVRRGDSTVAGDGPVQSEGALVAFGENGWGLGMWGAGGPATNGALLLTRIGVSNVDSGALAVTDTAGFHHVAVTRSGTEVVFYVDGVATAPVVYGEVFSFTSDLGIGMRGDGLLGGSNFFGLIDDVALWDRALTQQDIDSIVSGPLCGDGILDVSEACDDGNTTAGDGCDALCQTEAFVCPAGADPVCVDSEKGSLKVDERKPGKEKLKLSMKQLSESTAPGDFGDPVAGDTAFLVCLYSEAGALAGELLVDRAGDVCGPKAKPCWKATQKGPKYKDPDAASSGVKAIKTKAGPEKKGSLSAQAGNNAKQAQSSLPSGIAAGLAGGSEARVQVHTSDAGCFNVDVTEVKRADSDLFQGR